MSGSSIVDYSWQPKRQKRRGAIFRPRGPDWAPSGVEWVWWALEGEGSNLRRQEKIAKRQNRWQSVTCSPRGNQGLKQPPLSRILAFSCNDYRNHLNFV